MLFQSVAVMPPLLLLLMMMSATSTCDTFATNNYTEAVLQTVPTHDLRILTIVSGIADSIFLTIIIILLRILYSLQASSRATTAILRHTAVIVWINLLFLFYLHISGLLASRAAASPLRLSTRLKATLKAPLLPWKKKLNNGIILGTPWVFFVSSLEHWNFLCYQGTFGCCFYLTPYREHWILVTTLKFCAHWILVTTWNIETTLKHWILVTTLKHWNFVNYLETLKFCAPPWNIEF